MNDFKELLNGVLLCAEKKCTEKEKFFLCLISSIHFL